MSTLSSIRTGCSTEIVNFTQITNSMVLSKPSSCQLHRQTRNEKIEYSETQVNKSSSLKRASQMVSAFVNSLFQCATVIRYISESRILPSTSVRLWTFPNAQPRPYQHYEEYQQLIPTMTCVDHFHEYVRQVLELKFLILASKLAA